MRLNSGKIQTKSGHYIHLCEEGTPDRLFFDGVPVFIEVKRPGESIRPEQARKIAEFKQAGAIVVVCRDVLEAQKVLKVLNVFRKDIEIIKTIVSQIQTELNALGFDS